MVIAVIIAVIIVVTIGRLLCLVHAVGAHGGNLADVEALVGADALVLEVVLVLVNVAAEVDIALVGQGANGLADGLAGVGDVVQVQADGGNAAEEEGGDGEDDVARVVHIGGCVRGCCA